MFSINHYCLIVTDLERSLAFYRDVMGMSLRSRVTRTRRTSPPPSRAPASPCTTRSSTTPIPRTRRWS